MRIHLGCDHAGFDLNRELMGWLRGLGHEPVDHGPTEFDAQDDYPAFCIAAAEAVASDPGSLGIVVGGSGNGEQIAANKVLGIRAALVWSDATATLAREHNDANVISLGFRQNSIEECKRFITIFLDTPFSDEPRHLRRIAQLTSYEGSR